MKEKSDELKIEILEKVNTLAAAAFGLVAALAWNSAIQDLFVLFFPDQKSVIAKFIYAILVTILVVFLTSRIGGAISKLKEKIKPV